MGEQRAHVVCESERACLCCVCVCVFIRCDISFSTHLHLHLGQRNKMAIYLLFCGEYNILTLP